MAEPEAVMGDACEQIAEFRVTDPATWPPLLTAPEVAAIFRRSVGGLKKACQQHRFIPAPVQVQPYRWRKVDVERHLFGDGHALRKAWRRAG